MSENNKNMNQGLGAFSSGGNIDEAMANIDRTSAYQDIFEFNKSIDDSNAPINEAEDILTPLFQAKARALCPSDYTLAALTMRNLIRFIIDDGHDVFGNKRGNGNCDCCYDNFDDDNKSDTPANKEAGDRNIIDPEASLVEKASIVCKFLFGEYATYDQLPGEIKKAVDLARDAYAIIIGYVSKLESLLMHHFNDMPTMFIPSYFNIISGKAVYASALLDIIDPDHRADNYPEAESDDSTEVVNGNATNDKTTEAADDGATDNETNKASVDDESPEDLAKDCSEE